MARTTSNAVKELLQPGGDYDTVRNPSLTPFIQSATVVVDRVQTAAAANGRTLNSTELELIERWLAAHYYASSDQPYTSRSTAGASGSFQGQTGMYLEGTKYGQMAITLDYSGYLYSISSGPNRRTGKITWVGKPPSTQIDYQDRD